MSESPTPDAVTFYWRPGCGFCMMLSRRLTKLGVPMDRRNIWDDPESAAVVRSIADGNETVPTVVVGDVGMVNPSAGEVVAAIEQHAPHIQLAADEEDEQSGGLLGRLLGRD